MEHFFRHESGRLVSSLARVFSLKNLDFVEDVVQSSLLEALQSWRVSGVPENPGTWIPQVARNRILDLLRRDKMVARHAAALHDLQPDTIELALDDVLLDAELDDSQLRMIFACCHPALAEEDQIALTLRALCGFHPAEIGRALLVSELAVIKRLSRAKQQLVDAAVELEVPPPAALETRLAVVQKVLYLLFNEGYLSTFAESVIRQDLCEEAVRLVLILTQHPHCGTPATHALAALLLLHASRFAGRLDDAGRILLLAEQDRRQWDTNLIALGRRFLDRASRGHRISTYHLEAGIALEHCKAPSFQATNWPQIVRLYDVLLAVLPSSVTAIHRAIAVAEMNGPAAGFVALAEVRHLKELAQYHLLDATLGELYLRLGDRNAAAGQFESALAKTRSPAERDLLERKRARCRD